MKSFFRNFVLAIMATCFMTSCGEDELPEVTKAYDDGIFIVNQGPFMTGTGTISYIGRDSTQIVSSIFGKANSGKVLGNIAQSMVSHGDRYFIAINNAAKIITASSENFVAGPEILNINQPRYFASNGTKLYVSAWGADGTSGSVHEIDNDNLTLSPAIISGNGPEGMAIDGNFLYVAKGGGFGVDSTLVIINTTTNTVAKTLVVGTNPSRIVKDDDGSIFVLCSGSYDWVNPENSISGSLVKIVNQEIVAKTVLAPLSSELAIDTKNDVLYFGTTGSVVRQGTNLDVNNQKVIIDLPSFYALGFDEVEGLLYVTDAKDYTGNGEVIVFDSQDKEVKRFESGVIPGFVFVN